MADDFDYDAQRAMAARDAELLSLDEVLAFLGCTAEQLQADIDKGWAPRACRRPEGTTATGKVRWVRRWRRGELERSRSARAATQGAGHGG